MSGHSNFIFCVTVMPPDDKYPQGLIVTGSSDKTILGFTLNSPRPVFKLEGHSETGTYYHTLSSICGYKSQFVSNAYHYGCVVFYVFSVCSGCWKVWFTDQWILGYNS